MRSCMLGFGKSPHWPSPKAERERNLIPRAARGELEQHRVVLLLLALIASITLFGHIEASVWCGSSPIAAICLIRLENRVREALTRDDEGGLDVGDLAVGHRELDLVLQI